MGRTIFVMFHCAAINNLKDTIHTVVVLENAHMMLLYKFLLLGELCSSQSHIVSRLCVQPGGKEAGIPWVKSPVNRHVSIFVDRAI